MTVSQRHDLVVCGQAFDSDGDVGHGILTISNCEFAGSGPQIADVDVPPDEELKQLPVSPRGPEVRMKELSARLDQDAGGHEYLQSALPLLRLIPVQSPRRFGPLLQEIGLPKVSVVTMPGMATKGEPPTIQLKALAWSELKRKLQSRLKRGNLEVPIVLGRIFCEEYVLVTCPTGHVSPGTIHSAQPLQISSREV